MSLSFGTCVGLNDVEWALGTGGIGEVYRARDTRLSREVAIKSVNAASAERFEREALAISDLHHRHSCSLYNVGSFHGIPYLVMEPVEGQPLTGPLLWTEAVCHLASECDALSACLKKPLPAWE